LDLGRPGSNDLVAFSPDSSNMYIVAGSSTTEGAALLEISLDSCELTTRKIVLAGGANQSNEMAGVVLAGDILYVGDHDNEKIHKVERSSFNKTGEISLSCAPLNIALHPDGKHLFVLCGTDCGKISVFDLHTEIEVASIDCTHCLLGPPERCFPRGPTDIVFTSDGSKAYVAHGHQEDGGVSILFISETILAFLDIDPDTLNLKSKGKWITAYIELPEEYSVEDVDVESIRIEDTIASQKSDIQDGILMVKFSREEVIALIEGMGLTLPSDVDLKVIGKLNDDTSFEGIDTIRIIKPGKK